MDDQAANNYGYNAIGNLVSDNVEGITRIAWTVYGKIDSIYKNNGTTISYRYDAGGNRILKKVNNAETIYVRDASGNVMSTYTNDSAGLMQREVHLYGSSRVGLQQMALNLTNPDPEKIKTVGEITGKARTFDRGNKFFELSNHLGNVLVVVSDRKRSVANTGNPALISRYRPVILSAQDYLSFGGLMAGRTYESNAYRYGFNGKENDNEVKGQGNQQDYGMRIYDPRIGRFLSVDPITKKYPELTPYQFASNSPIAGIDQDGLEFFFAAGAGNDSWPGSNGYPDLMINAFRQAGINDVVQVNAHSFFKFSDINFALGKYGRQPYHTAQKEMVMISRDEFKIEDRLDSRITKSVGQVKSYLQNHPNSKQENNQVNLAGYSMGSVLMAQTALKIADEGTIIDNLILIGSTISPDSELGKTLDKYKSEGKIKNILYKNTTGDEVLYSASRGLQEDAILKTIRTIVLGNRNEGSKHLLLAGDKDDAKSNNERKRLANELVEEGVR